MAARLLDPGPMRIPCALLLVAACGGGGGSSVPDARADDPDATTEPPIDAEPPPDAEIPPDAVLDNGTTTFTATRLGDPQWETAGWQIFSAPPAIATASGIWSLHQFHSSVNAFGPDEVHPPPYDVEVADRAEALGFDTGDRFHRADWSYPSRSLWTFAVIVPSAGAPTGITSDDADGAMIPETLELYVDGDLFRGASNIDPEFDSQYPLLSQIDPTLSAQVEGWSHMTLTFGEDTRYIPGVAGDYVFRVHVYEVDTPANGWQIDLPFTVLE